MYVANAKSVDSDQTPRSAASDLGLHYLPISRLGDARHKWDNRDPNAKPLLKWDRSSRKYISPNEIILFLFKVDPF